VFFIAKTGAIDGNNKFQVSKATEGVGKEEENRRKETAQTGKVRLPSS
jgi:hypothetical protein